MGLFDGLAVSVDEPRRMIIQHPHLNVPLRNKETGEEAYLDLLSRDSEAFRKHERAVGDRRLARKAVKLKMEDLEAEAIEGFAKVTVGWSLVTLDGTPIPAPCTAANVRELFAMKEMAWLKRQADEFLSDLGNWTASSSKS